MSLEIQQSEIGEFPSSWDIDRIDSAFEIQQGKQVSKKNREGGNQQPFLRTKNVFWNRLELSDLDHMNFTEKEELRLELQPGDLLTCEGGDIGRTALWAGNVERCYYQNHLHRLRSENGRADPQFAFLVLVFVQYREALFRTRQRHHYSKFIAFQACGAAHAAPPIPEQKKIGKSCQRCSGRSKHRSGSFRPPTS